MPPGRCTSSCGGGPADCTLLHSRFRGVERAELMAEITGRPADRIVVATQVVEAGIDLNAAVLITEAAPWPSLVQRAGRCNRTGRVADAELWWVPPAKPQPYEQADIDASSAELAGSKAAPVTGERLLDRDVAVTETQVAVLRRATSSACSTPRRTSAAPTSTSPPMSGTPTTWTSSWPGRPGNREADDGRPPADAKAPPAQYRCRVPVGRAERPDAATCRVWRLDQVAGRWTRVTAARPGPARRGPADQRRRTAGTTRDSASIPSTRGPCPAARN